MANNSSLLPLVAFNVNAKTGAQIGDPVTPENSLQAEEFNKLSASLSALQFFFADINTVNVPDKERFGQVLNQVLANFAPATRLVRTVSGVESVLEIMASGGWRYARAGVTLFEVSPAGAVSGQVLTKTPDNITNEHVKAAGENTLLARVSASQGWEFVNNGAVVRRIDPTGALVPAEVGGGGTVSLGWKAPLLGDNPPRIAATAGVIPGIPARGTATVRVNFATGGFVGGGFVRIVNNGVASITRILAGRLSPFACREIATPSSGNNMPNSSGITGVQQTIYVNENYLKSAVFAEPAANCFAEVGGVSAQFFAGWEQSQNSVDALWGFSNTSNQGVFDIAGGKVQCNKAYLEPGLTGGTDLVIELFNATASGASSLIDNQNWIFQY